MSETNLETEVFEVEVFFDKPGADAGRHTLEEAGFDIEPRPDNLAGDGGQTVWLMARATRERDGDIDDLVQALQELLEPYGGMIWELGPCSVEGEPAAERYFEFMKHQFFQRTNIYPFPRNRAQQTQS